MTRRTYLSLIVNGGAVAAAAAIGAPAVIHVLSPVIQEPRGEDWRAIGPLERFAVHEMSLATVHMSEQWPPPFEPVAVYVWRVSGSDVVVYSRDCTDLRCPLNYDSGSGCFFCPCHGGIFSKDGQRMAGPPNRPMYRFASRIRDGVVEINLKSLPPSA